MEVLHTSGEGTGHTLESTPTATMVPKMKDVGGQSLQDDGTTLRYVATKLENQEDEYGTRRVVVKEEVASGSANVTEREDEARGEQESGGVNFGGMVTPSTRRTSRDREPYSSEHGDESQPKKRKRNIMNDKQVNVMEAALQSMPEMQRSPLAIQQWTNHLNKIVSPLHQRYTEISWYLCGYLPTSSGY